MNAHELQQSAALLPVSLTAEVCEQLIAFVDLLEKWNRAYNLTAIRNRDEMFSAHILDSLSIDAYITGEHVLDVGAGAGLPGLVLAIVDPRRQLTLLDSNGKKTRFLTEAVRSLELSNVAIHRGRVEEFESAAGFDQITSRAFTALPRFVELCGRLLRPGGELLAMMGKSPDAETEAELERVLSELPIPFTVHGCLPLTVPGIATPRHISVIKKT